ncbi:TPA: hypothetical protein U2K00_003047 [Legionella pneumophila]|nr:hypothetical protein [Legionella pneumophila]
MENKNPVTSDKKQVLLDQIKKIQSKIDAIEKQRADKINKLAKKFKLLDLEDEIIEKEFSLIKEKYSSVLEKSPQTDAIKKN